LATALPTSGFNLFLSVSLPGMASPL
jgi:hypothetical protein